MMAMPAFDSPPAQVQRVAIAPNLLVGRGRGGG